MTPVENIRSGEEVSRASRRRVLLVLTREIPERPRSGRERTLGFVQRALADRNEISHFVIHSLVHQPSLVRVLRAVSRLIAGRARRQSCPLQVALFSNGADCSALFDAIEKHRADVVYFDGVRLLDWLVAARRRYPELRLICDFDDLMSLRFSRLLRGNLPISLGYLASVTPPWVQEFLRRGFVTRAIIKYESVSLRGAEKLAVEVADAVTVVSSSDIDQLRSDVGSALATKTHVIPPGVNFQRSSIITTICRQFVFVGSDSLLQNRLSIEFLLALWAETRPAIPLRIVGRMLNTYAACARVEFSGFVENLAEVYGDGCIALCPSFIEGGIKTKLLEALGYGVIPVGNAFTFEGIGCDPGGLAMSTEEIRRFVVDPQSRIDELRGVAESLRQWVFDRYSFDAVNAAWSCLISTPSLPLKP